MITDMNKLDWAGWLLVGMAVRDKWHEIEWPFTKITLMDPGMAQNLYLHIQIMESLADLMERSFEMPDVVRPVHETRVDLHMLQIHQATVKVGYDPGSNQLFVSEPEEI